MPKQVTAKEFAEAYRTKYKGKFDKYSDDEIVAAAFQKNKELKNSLEVIPEVQAVKNAQGAVGRFVQGALPVGDMLDLAGNTLTAAASDVGNIASGEFGDFKPGVAMNPLSNFLFPNVGKVLNPVAEGMITKPMKENWSFSDKDPAAINALQGLPLVGPALDAIGADVKSGNYAGALGQTAGLAAPLAVGKFRQTVGIPGILRNPEGLRAAATEQYINAIAPYANPEVLATAKEVAPGLLKRNVWATSLPRLGKQVEGTTTLLMEKKLAEENAIREGSKPGQVVTSKEGATPPDVQYPEVPAIPSALRGLEEKQKFGNLVPERVFVGEGRGLPYLTPTDLNARKPTISIETTIDNTIDAQKLIDDVKAMRDSDVYVAGTDVLKSDAAKARHKAYNSFIEMIEKVREKLGTNIPADRILDLKGEWQTEVKNAGGYAKAPNTVVSPKVGAKKKVVHSLKETLDEKFEKLGNINEEMSFWLDVKKLTDRADKVRRVDPTGLEVGMETHAVGEGVRKGAGALGKAVGTVLLPLKTIKEVANLVRSPGWKMWNAHRKYQLAEAVASGNRYKVESIILAVNKSLEGVNKNGEQK